MWRRHFPALLWALAAGRAGAQGERPRLLLNLPRLAALQAALASTHAELWRAARRKADSILSKGLPKPQAPEGPNDEQLWQREVANKIPLLALVALLSSDTKYFNATVEWSTASCIYPHWGLGNDDGVGLAAGHQLFSLALVYDWLGDRLPGETRDLLRRTLLERGATMAKALRGDFPPMQTYWRQLSLTNRLWVNTAGLAAAGWALGDSEPSVRPWCDLALEKFQQTENLRGADGASHEGIEYWSYGLEYQLKFWHMASELAGGATPSSAWWKNTAAYRLYLGLPRHAWREDNTAIDLADSERADGYGADHLLFRLAALHRDPHAQWLASELRRAKVTNSISHWLNLLWFDPTVPLTPPTDLPTLRHFEDIGIVSARSGWSGDESLVVFKCGPAIGHFATDKLTANLGIGHNHPDANHFTLFGCGQWLLRDDGYAWKDTGQHNTLLIDGHGQTGEGSAWFNAGGLQVNPELRVHPRVVRAVSSDTVDEIAGDATRAYPVAAGLRRFLRRLYFLKPDVLIVFDEIEVDRPRRLELRLHPEYPCEEVADGLFVSRGPQAALRIELLGPDKEIEAAAGVVNGRSKSGQALPLHTLRITTAKRATWTHVAAVSWSPAGRDPVRVTAERLAQGWTFRAGERAVTVPEATGVRQ